MGVIWQDFAITALNLLLSVSLIPQVYYGYKYKKGPIKYQTSVPTCIGLYLLSGVYMSLFLYSSAVISAVVATLWGVLFWQRWVYQRNEG